MTNLQVWQTVLDEWMDAVAHPKFWTCPHSKETFFATGTLSEGICHSLQVMLHKEQSITPGQYEYLKAQLPGNGSFAWPKTEEGAKERVKWLESIIRKLS